MRKYNVYCWSPHISIISLVSLVVTARGRGSQLAPSMMYYVQQLAHATLATPAALLVPGHHQLPSCCEVHHTHYIMCQVTCKCKYQAYNLFSRWILVCWRGAGDLTIAQLGTRITDRAAGHRGQTGYCDAPAGTPPRGHIRAIIMQMMYTYTCRVKEGFRVVCCTT